MAVLIIIEKLFIVQTQEEETWKWSNVCFFISEMKLERESKFNSKFEYFSSEIKFEDDFFNLTKDQYYLTYASLFYNYCFASIYIGSKL